MAATTAADLALAYQNTDDLTDEQIDALLARATARLQAKAQAKDNNQDVMKLDTDQRLTFPKLQTGQLEKPYISTTKQNVATADNARLLDESQRKKAVGIRRVSEPVMSKKLAKEVCNPNASLERNCNEENQSQIFLEQSPAAVLA